MEFIVLSILLLGVLCFAGFVFYTSQKQIQILQKQMKDIAQMLMAGSFQEWERVQKGKKPVPNQIKSEPNFSGLREEERIPWNDIKNIQVENGPKRQIKIYS
jgi:hypothetical protein